MFQIRFLNQKYNNTKLSRILSSVSPEEQQLYKIAVKLDKDYAQTPVIANKHIRRFNKLFIKNKSAAKALIKEREGLKCNEKLKPFLNDIPELTKRLIKYLSS